MGSLTKPRMSASGHHRAGPFITDVTRGLRTELSGATFEQWVAKTANWLESEFGPGVHLHVDMRPHWLWPITLAALDEIEGTLVPLSEADAMLCLDPREGMPVPVVAVHEHAMAMPFLRALPPGNIDFYREVRGGADTRPVMIGHDAALLRDAAGNEWRADRLMELVPEVERRSRIAMMVEEERPVTTAEQIALLCLLPWVSQSSMVIAHSTASLQGERCRLSIDLPSA